MIELKKNEVDDFVKNGDVYERLGMVIGSLQARDRKYGRGAFVARHESENVVNTLATWILQYVPSLRDFKHVRKDGEPLGDWKTLCMNIAFGWEKLRIIG